MKQIVQDWKDFCENKADYDKSHFSGLFHYQLTEDEMKIICGFFNNSSALALRLKEVISAGRFSHGTYLTPSNRCEPEVVADLIKKDIENFKNICIKLRDSELYSILDRVEYCYKPDCLEVSNIARMDNPGQWLFDTVGDYVDEVRGYNNKVLALEEACFGLASNYYLAWYILGASIPLGLDFIPYFDVWRNGGVYAVTENEVLFSSI